MTSILVGFSKRLDNLLKCSFKVFSRELKWFTFFPMGFLFSYQIFHASKGNIEIVTRCKPMLNLI